MLIITGGVPLADRVAAISQTQDDPETFEASFEYRLRILRPSVYTVCWRRPAEGTSFAPGAGEDESFRTEVGASARPKLN